MTSETSLMVRPNAAVTDNAQIYTVGHEKMWHFTYVHIFAN